MVDAGWIDADGNQLGAGFKTPEQGAATQVWAATSPAVAHLGGVYAEDCAVVTPVTDPATGQVVRGYRVDPAEAARLWRLSAHLTGVNVVA